MAGRLLQFPLTAAPKTIFSHDFGRTYELRVTIDPRYTVVGNAVISRMRVICGTGDGAEVEFDADLYPTSFSVVARTLTIQAYGEVDVAGGVPAYPQLQTSVIAAPGYTDNQLEYTSPVILYPGGAGTVYPMPRYARTVSVIPCSEPTLIGGLPASSYIIFWDNSVATAGNLEYHGAVDAQEAVLRPMPVPRVGLGRTAAQSTVITDRWWFYSLGADAGHCHVRFYLKV